MQNLNWRNKLCTYNIYLPYLTWEEGTLSSVGIFPWSHACIQLICGMNSKTLIHIVACTNESGALSMWIGEKLNLLALFKFIQTSLNNFFINSMHLEQAIVFLNILSKNLNHGDSGSSIKYEQSLKFLENKWLPSMAAKNFDVWIC
jgi:hypothetical protein